MKKVLITGGSGLVGKSLISMLISKGYDVVILSRTTRGMPNVKCFQWDYKNGFIEEGAFEGVNYIVHLAGANIGEKPWTKKRKLEIIESRTLTTELLYKKIEEHNIKLEAFISASAVGYYGAITSDKIYVENDAASNDFLGKVCLKWERAVDEFEAIKIRTIKLRTGVVLTENGGALEKMMKPMKYKLGAAVGNGKQFMPWIHIMDLCNIYLEAIENPKMQGAINAVSPEYTNNKEFTLSLAKHIGKKVFLPNVPSVLLKLSLGEMANIILHGSRVEPKALKDLGFEFQYAKLDEALADLFKRNSI